MFPVRLPAFPWLFHLRELTPWQYLYPETQNLTETPSYIQMSYSSIGLRSENLSVHRQALYTYRLHRHG